MGRYSDRDYAQLAKTGFLLGLSMFVVGIAGDVLVHAYFESVPAWEETLLFDLEVVGLLVGFFSPLVFGIVLPLTE